jgi:hypothetical protein
MIVKIGKYIHWYNVRKLEDKYLKWRHKKYAWDIAESEHDWIDNTMLKFFDVWQTVLHYTINQIQKRRERKVKVHVDRWDVWNANETLAHVILPVLERLRETKQGAPFVDLEDVPKKLRGEKLTKKQRENGEVGDDHFKRWDYVLDAMIWSFQEIANDMPGEEEFSTGERDVMWTPVDEKGNEVSEDYDGVKFYRMDKGPNDTHQFDKKGFDKYNKRIDEGLRLFGKYYRALWN